MISAMMTLSLFIVIKIIDGIGQGVPQGSVPGPLLLNIYLNNLFFLFEFIGVCNFDNGTTFYTCEMDLNYSIKMLKHDNFLANARFENNNIKLSQDKCQLPVSGYKNENVWADMENEVILESNKRKLLGLDIDRNLN